MDGSLAAKPANFAEGLAAAAAGDLYALVAYLAEHLGRACRTASAAAPASAGLLLASVVISSCQFFWAACKGRQIKCWCSRRC